MGFKSSIREAKVNRGTENDWRSQALSTPTGTPRFPQRPKESRAYVPIIRYRPTPSGPADTRTGATRGEVSYAPVWEGDWHAVSEKPSLPGPPLHIFQTKPWSITQHPQMQREDGRGGRGPSWSLFSTLSKNADSPHIRKKNEKVCGGEYIHEKASPSLPKYASAGPRSRFGRQNQKQAVNDSLVRKLALCRPSAGRSWEVKDKNQRKKRLRWWLCFRSL